MKKRTRIKNIILKKIKRKKNNINYENFTKEALVEILRVYEQYNQIINNKNKKNKFGVIHINSHKILSIGKLCHIFRVSKSGYYKHIKLLNTTKDKDIKLKGIITKILYRHNKNASYRKIVYYVLKETGVKYNHKKIYRIMKELGLKSDIRVVRKYKTEDKILKNKFKYLIERDFSSQNKF